MGMVPRIAGRWTIVLAVTGGWWWAGGAHASPAEPPLIIATTSIWADIVEQLDCGNELDVHL